MVSCSLVLLAVGGNIHHIYGILFFLNVAGGPYIEKLRGAPVGEVRRGAVSTVLLYPPITIRYVRDSGRE